MHFVSFKTDAPLSHIQRALDELNRAGFALNELHVDHDKQGCFCVRIHYHREATVASTTYQTRLARMPDVWAVQGGALSEQVFAPLESA